MVAWAQPVVWTREAVSTLASERRVASFQNRHRCKDGTYRWLQWSAVPSRNLIQAAARDVTEQKRAEETLRIGIAPEDQREIFDPFVQLNPGTSSREGAGLGLSLSRKFIEPPGGEISVRSRAWWGRRLHV